MAEPEQADYYYFNPSGKWKYHGKGANIPRAMWGESLTHNNIAELNGGHMPGITGDGTSYFIVIIDGESFPRFIYPDDKERLFDISNIAFSKAAYTKHRPEPNERLA